MSEIKIIDSIMGSGKSSYAIQKMNEDANSKYIYITPFLSEVERVKENCKSRKFYEPQNFGNGKLDNFHDLLLQGKNIASTHALFRMATEVTRQLIENNGYVLILDEVMDVIEEANLKKDDIPSMKQLGLIHIDEESKIVFWNKDRIDYDGKYNDIKTMCLNKSLFIVNDTLLMWTFPADIFDSFKEVYVLSYLFNAQIQRYYYDLFNIEYTYFSVIKENDRYIIEPKQQLLEDDKSMIRNNINILEDDINKIGEDTYALSSSWFRKDKNKILINQLKNNIYNYYKHKIKSKSKDNIWTTFKSAKTKLSGEGYTRGFVPVNSRATNEYKDKTGLAYCANIFLNPIIKQFFIDKGVKIEEDTYALSEMLQWIWRSAIRNNKSINIYIPSSRMRNLLTNWLD